MVNLSAIIFGHLHKTSNHTHSPHILISYLLSLVSSLIIAFEMRNL